MECRGPARPWRCRVCGPESEALRRTAAVNVSLSCEKLDDEVRDERGLKRLGARLARLCLRRARRKAEAAAPDFTSLSKTQMERIWTLETARDPVMDRHADAFAQLLCACGDFFADEALRRPARELMGHVGRYLYLVDALDDLPKDVKSGTFNPLKLRFSLRDGELTPEDREYLLLSIRQSLNRAAAALELLPLKGSDELLHNIVYLGLPAVLQSVAEGSFHTNDMRIRRKL